MSAIDFFKKLYELLSNLRRVHAIYMYVNEYVLYMWSCDILIQMDAKRGKAGAMIRIEVQMTGAQSQEDKNAALGPKNVFTL